MDKKRFAVVNTLRTVCEVLREIYWSTEDPVIRDKTVEATIMAKKMDQRLRQYKEGWDKDEWESLDEDEIKRRQEQRAILYLNEQK